MQLATDAIGVKDGVELRALFKFNGLGQGLSIAIAACRLTQGFARDGSLPWSQYFAHVDPV